MLDWTEIILRLGVATLAGGLIGLNRDLHGKPIGLKTLALVSLATAMVLVLVHSDEAKIVSDAGSRVMQGILTGIGFLGAGVIVHAERHFRVRGLTSAACTWLAACIGIVCGLGQWRIGDSSHWSSPLAVLTVGRRLERWLHARSAARTSPRSNRRLSPVGQASEVVADAARPRTAATRRFAAGPPGCPMPTAGLPIDGRRFHQRCRMDGCPAPSKFSCWKRCRRAKKGAGFFADRQQ